VAAAPWVLAEEKLVRAFLVMAPPSFFGVTETMVTAYTI